MAKWKVSAERRFSVASAGPDGLRVRSGVNVYIARGDRRDRKIAVWYELPRGEAATPPQQAVAAYLDHDDPPRKLLVTRGGEVSVLRPDV